MHILEADPSESFAFQRLLDLYRQRDGNIDALVHELEQRVSSDVHAYAPRMLLGHIDKAQNENDQARAAYRAAAALRPNDPAPLVALADLDATTGHADEARHLYRQALDHTRGDDDRRELWRKLGGLALDAHDYDGARRAYDELARDAHGSVYLMTEYARALVQRGDNRRAVAEYQRVTQALHGDNRVLSPVLRDMGGAQLAAGDVDGAIQTLDRALRFAGRAGGVRKEIYDALVDAYRRGDRLPELVDKLHHEPGTFETYDLIGRLDDELGNDDEALAAYRHALRISPRDIDTRVRVVQLLSRSGHIDEVIEEYRALLRAAPREPRFVVELAQLLMQVGRRDEAQRLAEMTSHRYPRDPAVHQALAELYTRWNDQEHATREIATLARIEPNDPQHLIALGEQQLSDGDRAAAVATWRRILTVDSDHARAHATLGGVYADHDMLDEAAAQYHEAVHLSGDTLEYVRGLANVLERLRNDDEAVTMWRRVLALAGKDRAAKREARQRIVAIWSRAHQLAQHINELARAFGATPPDVEAGRFLAEAYRRLGPDHAAEAERVLERVIALEPGDVESLLALERAHTAHGDLAGAIAVLHKLVEADPRRATTYLERMAEYSLSLYRDQDAVHYAEQAVQRSPDDASAQKRLGDLYRSRQDLDAAITSYERAIALNARLYPTYLELAELYVAKGQADKADRLYRAVTQGSPDDDLVVRAVRASMLIHLGAGTLEALEQDLLPLAIGHPQRPIFRKLLVELYDSLATPLIRTAQQGGAAGAQATEHLQRIGTRAIKPLLEALADDDPAQRRVAIDILGYLGNANAAAPLLAMAEGNGDWALRQRALVAAGAVASPSLAPRFATLARGPDARLRASAAWALARIGGPTVIPILRRLLDRADGEVRAFAAVGLGQARDRASAPRLEQLLRTERRSFVRAAAAWALGRTGDASDVPALVSALRGDDRLLARGAAVALGELGGDEARRELCDDLFDPDATQRAAAAVAIERMQASAAPRQGSAPPLPLPAGTASPIDYLSTLLHAEASDPATPIDIVSLHGPIVAAARAGLRGPVEQAEAVLEVLGSRPDGIGLGPLTASLDAWPAASRDTAATALTAIGHALVDDLLQAAQHPEPAVRERVLILLAHIDDPRAAAALATALDDSADSVQSAALEALGAHQAGTPGLADRLARIVTDAPSWSTRMRAAGTIRAGGRRGRPRCPGRGAASRSLRLRAPGGGAGPRGARRGRVGGAARRSAAGRRGAPGAGRGGPGAPGDGRPERARRPGCGGPAGRPETRTGAPGRRPGRGGEPLNRLGRGGAGWGGVATDIAEFRPLVYKGGAGLGGAGFRMSDYIGIACGRCDTFTPMGAPRCVECGNNLGLGVPEQAPTDGRSETAEHSRGPVTASEEEAMEQARNYICKQCSTPVPSGHKFCGACGATVPPEVQNPSTEYFGAMQAPGKARLILIRGDQGIDGLSYLLQGTEHVAGREDAQILFPEDPWLSSRHANFIYRQEKLVVRDEGSKNGVYVRLREPVTLQAGDHVLCGEQVLRLEATPKDTSGPSTDGTYFYSSPKRPSPFRIVQILVGGVPGMIYCTRENAVTIGREDCEMNFPEDIFISGVHARIEMNPDGSFTLTDNDSKNGTYLRIRGERELSHGDYLFMGKQLLRVEMTA